MENLLIENINSQIHTIREQKVMIDKDLINKICKYGFPMVMNQEFQKIKPLLIKLVL